MEPGSGPSVMRYHARPHRGSRAAASSLGEEEEAEPEKKRNEVPGPRRPRQRFEGRERSPNLGRLGRGNLF